MGEVISLSKERIKEHRKNYKSTKIRRTTRVESYNNDVPYFLFNKFFEERFIVPKDDLFPKNK